eukprot:6492566-Amphidinium_carterae.1
MACRQRSRQRRMMSEQGIANSPPTNQTTRTPTARSKRSSNCHNRDRSSRSSASSSSDSGSTTSVLTGGGNSSTQGAGVPARSCRPKVTNNALAAPPPKGTTALCI